MSVDNADIVQRILGSSTWAQTMRRRVPQIARHHYHVVITGPPGTGKQFLARTIHEASPRREKPLVPVDCSMLGEQSFASGLFGHEAGALPHAKGAALGALRVADGGTLFLARIDSLALELQHQLLDLLKLKQVTPIGAARRFDFDVRIIASSLSDLQKEVQGQCFLPELYTLIEAVSLSTTELVRRSDDIAPLADHFLAEVADDYDEPLKRLTPEALEVLKRYLWPGNVAELRNTIERAAVEADEDEFLGAAAFDFLENDADA